MAGETLQHPLELALDRSAVGLALPAQESAAVEVEDCEESLEHRPEI
jgi:hypothetical protein